MTRFTTLFLAAVGAFGQQAFSQHAIAPPRLGFVADGSRTLRPLYGMAGSFILGPAVRGAVVSQAFSGSLGLLKTNLFLAAFDPQGQPLGSIDVSRGPALFAFSPDGTAALAYVGSRDALYDDALYEWKRGAFSRSWVRPVDGRVLAIAFPTAFEAARIVERSAGDIWEIREPLGGLGTLSEKALPDVHAPLLALPSGDLVYAGAGAIVVRHPTGTEVHIPATLPASFSLQQMNRDWVELAGQSTKAHFAIRTTPAREGIYQLPE